MSAVRPEPMPVAGTSAVHSAYETEDGSTYTTLELSVKFVRSISMKTGEIRAGGETLHVGRQTASVQGHLTDLRASCLPMPRQRVWCSPHHGAKAAVPNFVMSIHGEYKCLTNDGSLLLALE